MSVSSGINAIQRKVSFLRENLSMELFGYILGGLGAAFFSMKAVLIKLAYLPGGGLEANELDVMTLLALRMGIAMPIYIAIGCWILRRQRQKGVNPPSGRAILTAAVTGLLGYFVCSYTDFYGLKFITAQLERLLLFTYPAFVFILAPLFFGGRFTPHGFASILIAYGGIMAIFMGGDIATGENLLLGSGLVLACAFLFAFFQLLAKPQIDAMGSGLFTCIAMTSASMAILLSFFLPNAVDGTLVQDLSLPPRIFILAAMIAIVSTLIPSFLINMALARIGAEAVATLGMLGPIATVLFAIILLGEPFGWVDGIGTAITMFGIGLYSWYDRRKLRVAPTSS